MPLAGIDFALQGSDLCCLLCKLVDLLTGCGIECSTPFVRDAYLGGKFLNFLFGSRASGGLLLRLGQDEIELLLLLLEVLSNLYRLVRWAICFPRPSAFVTAAASEDSLRCRLLFN
jgi:hypothetical protein